MLNKLSLVTPLKIICRKAGEAILDIYDHEDNFQVEQKSDQSPLTLADRKANQIICSGLEKLDPQWPIVSEENREIPFSRRRDFDYYWLVDPLDGTKEFIKRNGEFTVNIALIHRQRPVAGFVYAPVLDELYWAVKGEGAYRQKGELEEMKLQVDTFRKSDPALNIVCSRSHLNDDTRLFVDQFADPHLVPKGSSLKFLVLAVGEAQIYPRLAPTMEWDTAAAQIIVEEAGGQVLNFETNKPLQYNKENLRNPSFVAYAQMIGE